MAAGDLEADGPRRRQRNRRTSRAWIRAPAGSTADTPGRRQARPVVLSGGIPSHPSEPRRELFLEPSVSGVETPLSPIFALP